MTLIVVGIGFLPGILASALLFVGVLFVLWVPILIVTACVKIASISVTGAIVIFILIAILLSTLIRKYKTAILELFAWIMLALRWVGVFGKKLAPAGTHTLARATTPNVGGQLVSDKPDRPLVPMNVNEVSTLGDLIRVAQSSISAEVLMKLRKKQAQRINSETALGEAVLQHDEVGYKLDNIERSRAFKDGEFGIQVHDQQLRSLKVSAEVEEFKNARMQRGQTAIPSEADNIRAESDALKAKTEKLKQEIEYEKLKAEFDKVAKPAPQPEPKREQDPIEKFIEEQMAEHGQRLKEEEFRTRLDAAIATLKSLGVDAERVERAGKKFYEDRFPGRQWRRSNQTI